jgi:membrane dipeptidase
MVLQLQPRFCIADLHCDLLWYLSLDEKRTANDLEVRCAIPQLKSGNVYLQTMAIFVETGNGSVDQAKKQAEIFCELPTKYPEIFKWHKKNDGNDFRIAIIPAIENASAICDEHEDLIKALERFTALQRKIGKMLYVSLTWNGENRFGGGALTKIGLKNDGKQLVDYLYEHAIAVDLSHTSDYLAFDLLNYIDKKNLSIPIMASHSNMRVISNVPRNLPDDIAKEIVNKKGLIGINFVRDFIGKDSGYFVKQLESMLNIGGEESICFGADFFCEKDLPFEIRKPKDVYFFPGYNNAGVYEKVIHLWKRELKISDVILEKICMGNFLRFIENKGCLMKPPL